MARRSGRVQWDPLSYWISRPPQDKLSTRSPIVQRLKQKRHRLFTPHQAALKMRDTELGVLPDDVISRPTMRVSGHFSSSCDGFHHSRTIENTQCGRGRRQLNPTVTTIRVQHPERARNWLADVLQVGNRLDSMGLLISLAGPLPGTLIGIHAQAQSALPARFDRASPTARESLIHSSVHLVMAADIEQDDLFVRHRNREDDAVVVCGVTGVITLPSLPTSR